MIPAGSCNFRRKQFWRSIVPDSRGELQSLSHSETGDGRTEKAEYTGKKGKSLTIHVETKKDLKQLKKQLKKAGAVKTKVKTG